MRRSLRWRIQAWHALILGLVVAGATTVFYLQVRRSRFDEIDAELLACARVLEGVLRTVPEGPPDQGPGSEDGESPDPPPQGRLRPPPRPRDRRFEQALSLPPSFEERYVEEGQDPYFVIWRHDGEILRAEPPSAADEVPLDPWIRPEWQENARSRGRLREVSLLGPTETVILVGRPIGRELHDLRGLAWRLGLSGLGVFAAGLLGGWWLSGRAVRPIATMSHTVASITASSLSRRIDLEGVDTELGELGGLLNTMLGRLEASFDQQVRFTADASHELRTPLAVVLAQVELALSRPRSAHEYREALETCGRAARRMKGLVDDLLTLARADAGELELRWELVDLGPIIEECAEMLRPLAEGRGVCVVVKPGGAKLEADAARLERVMTNLLSNAILYNRPGGQVTLSLASAGESVVLTVADTGVGIPEAELPRVFDRFFRVDKARSRESGGSGLGLAICKSIVDAHGGTIAVASQPGQGTEVVVRLSRTGIVPEL